MPSSDSLDTLNFNGTYLFMKRNDVAKFREDLLNIAKTTISSKILTQYKEMFAELAVNAVLRLKGSGNLDAIQIIKKLGGGLQDSYLDEGITAFIRLENITGQPHYNTHVRVHKSHRVIDEVHSSFCHDWSSPTAYGVPVHIPYLRYLLELAFIS